jgi:integrase
VRQLADHFHTAPDRLSEQQVRGYFLHLKNDRNFASASLGIAYSGIKFFYSHTSPRDWPTLKRLRVRRDKKLPDVLSVAEVRQLIATVRTPHNKTYFQTVYSLRLRLGEGLHLQVGDIDSGRMMVHVHRGKEGISPIAAKIHGKAAESPDSLISRSSRDTDRMSTARSPGSCRCSRRPCLCLGASSWLSGPGGR